jgi:protein-arginine kinase activator protein McsA
MKVIRSLTCPICSFQFTTQHSTKKFCSNKCYKTDRQKKIYEWIKRDKINKRIYKILVCPICSTQFTTHHKLKKFCSNKCYLQDRKNRIKDWAKTPKGKKILAKGLKKWFKKNYDKDPEFRKKVSEAQKKQRAKYPEKTKAIDKDNYWMRKNNPITYERDKKNKNNWLKNKKKEDPYYKIRASLSASLVQFLKREGTSKYGSISKLIGVSKEELKKHIETKWYSHPVTGEMMSWNNYGLKGWHIDHKIPFEAFKKYDVTKEETQKKIMSLENLQPMWGDQNRSKSNKY